MWFDPVEREQLLALLDALAPRCCLEWGSGGSAAVILAHHPRIESYCSIEHDAAWHERVAASRSDPRVSLQLVPPNRPLRLWRSEARRMAWNARAERDPRLLRDYVEWPARHGRRFDFVLVDGRARRFCLPVGFACLEPGGALVLHDAQRPEYRDALHALGPVEYLEPWVQGQLAIVRKGPTAERSR
jgi:hypothetical protein